MLKKSLAIGVMAGIIAVTTGCGDKKIAFVPKVEKKQIESVTITGSATALKRLTVGGGDERVASLSKSGKWLLSEVASKDLSTRETVQVLMKLDVNNPNVKMILTPSNSTSTNGSWLPDESAFVYTSNRLGNNAIVQSLGVNGGSGVKFLTKNSLGNSRHPDVSPDGKKIAFTVNDNIAMMDRDGNNMIMFGKGYRPKFSSDNNSLVFFANAGSHAHIYTMSIDGGSMLQLTSDNTKDVAPVWSPDNKHIAFVSNRVGGNMHLFVMDRNGGGIIQLTDGEFNITSLTWGSDGFIYFSADLNNNEDIWRLKPVLN